jgi:hypothetical protein
MKPILDQYQTDLSKQPERIQRHIRRGESLGRLLLRVSDYLRRLYRWVHSGAHPHSRGEEMQPTVQGASVLDVKLDESEAAKVQEGNARAANDEDYQSVA